MTGAAALGGVALTQRAETKRARAADQRRIRDAKAERLRRLYEPYVKFAMLLQQVAREQAYVLLGDTVEERNARHQREMAEGMRQVSEVTAAAVIEPGTEGVRKAYEVTYRAADRYLRSLIVNAHCSTNLDDLNAQFDAIGLATDTLMGTVVAELSALEAPL